MAMVVVQNPAPVMQPPVMMVQQPASPTVVMMQQPATTHVVMQQQQSQQPEVVCKAKLGGKPTITACNSCKQRMQTRVLYKVGWFSWAMAILLCFIGLFWGPCLIAFFWSKCKDAHHYCTSCNAKLDVHKPCC
ncbi:lipopolysaccharide-induced tumor necrosis factor-alpha factor homolog [Engraulis encrasicolus]|uniref:lipopolysaccharide-induced tumor necrosis factor-alpha factor homolog n=1 Tax=Engraulis encrasicolus TaxID=184585 RepID=UPI002FCF828A